MCTSTALLREDKLHFGLVLKEYNYRNALAFTTSLHSGGKHGPPKLTSSTKLSNAEKLQKLHFTPSFLVWKNQSMPLILCIIWKSSASIHKRAHKTALKLHAHFLHYAHNLPRSRSGAGGCQPLSRSPLVFFFLCWCRRLTALRANVSPFPSLMQGVFCCLRSFLFLSLATNICGTRPLGTSVPNTKIPPKAATMYVKSTAVRLHPQ